MADPSKFTPGYDYSDFEASQPNKPKPGVRLDTDFANVATSINEIVEAVKDVRRSDGALKNGIVTAEALSSGLSQQITDGAAETALGPALAAAETATQAAIEAALYDPTLRYKDRPALVASTRAAAGVGTLWQAGYSLFDEAAAGVTDQHAQNSATPPVKLYARPLPMGFNLADFGAVGGDATADTAAFLKAAAIGAGKSFIVPPSDSPYVVNSTIDILTGQHWFFAGATISTTSEAGPIFRTNSVSDWAMTGNLDLVGTLTTAATVSTAIGVQITNGKRYRMQGITARLFKGDGFLVDGSTTGGTALRGDRGQWSDCSAHQNTTGIEFAPGAGAEYVTVSNFTASGNILGVAVDAGNVTFEAGNIVDNTNGIFLTGIGGNNCHGIFNGVNINHNTQSNIKADGVTRGHTFTGCHIYGNAAGSQGNIWFLNSQGISISGGVIDAWIYNDLGANTRAGINRVVGARFPTNHTGGTGNTTLQSNDGGLVNLEVLDCWTSSGPAALNDPAPIYVRATRGASTQALTSGAQTVLIFNSKTGDKKGALDTTTGVYTAKATGIHRVAMMAHITGTGLSAPFGSARVNGSVVGYFSGSLPSSTLAFVGGVIDIPMTEGQTLELTAQVTGTSPVLAVNTSRLNIEMLR